MAEKVSALALDFDSCYLMYIHHYCRAQLFGEVFSKGDLVRSRRFYEGMAAVLVPDHDYPIISQRLRDSGHCPPKEEDFLKSRALQIFQMDKAVGERYLEKGRDVLADLIEREQYQELKYRLMLKQLQNGSVRLS